MNNQKVNQEKETANKNQKDYSRITRNSHVLPQAFGNLKNQAETHPTNLLRVADQFESNNT